MARFIYKPLQSSRAIRLIRFLPGPEPTCQMITVEVEKAPPYLALSYTWGDESPSKEIGVDGYYIPITGNLAEAINAIFVFARDRKMMLWIDAISINQSDVHERSKQVRLMNTIYRAAEIVVIWLGQAADDSDLAFDKMKQWKARLDDLKRLNGGSEELAVASIPSDDPLFFGPSDSEQGRVLEAMQKLWRRSWWTRAWIVQEGSIAHSSRTHFFCGSRSVDWTHVRAVLLITHHVTHVRNTGKAVDIDVDRNMAVVLEKLRNDREIGAHIDLSRVLRHIRAYACKDPRDKVYAALGMAMDVTENDIIPDYTKSLSDVYRDVVNFLLSKSNFTCLDFLGEVWRSAPGTAFDHKLESALPSWIPDYRFRAFLQPLEKVLNLDAYGENQKAYNACSSYKGGCCIDSSRLYVQGSRVDYITSVYSTCERKFAEGAFETEREWIPEDPSKVYIMGGSSMEAFNHTMVADLGRQNLDSDSELTRNFAFDWDIVEQDRDSLPALERLRQAWMIVDAKLMTVGRRFFVTSRGFFGLGPPAAQIGDEVSVLLGGQVLYVLRARRDDQHEFIGECYLHGMMDGEACEDEYFKIQEIVLV